MREVTLTVKLLVNDDTRPAKWVAEAIEQNLEAGEKVVDVETTSDETVED